MDLTNQTLYFHCISGTKGTSIMCKTGIMETVIKEINGQKVPIRQQVDCTYGVLVIDGFTREDVQNLKLKKDQVMEGCHLSTNPVTDVNDQPTGMFWVE